MNESDISIDNQKKKKKGKCFKMIRRLSVALSKKSKNHQDSEENLSHDSGHTLKIHRHVNGGDSNVDMTEDEVRKTLKREDLIQNHIEKEQALEEIKTKVSTLDGILHQLNEDYVLLEACCFCTKEVEMQEMIIEAINNYERRVVFNDPGSDEGKGDTEALVSPINRLRKDSERLYAKRHEQMIKERHYAKMSTEEIVKELVTQEDRLTKYNMQFKDMEMRLEKMSKDYHVAREQYIWTRYDLLRDIIEEATMDCIPIR